MPATAKLLKRASGLITCHSALNILAWHFNTPQLLLDPEETRQRHFEKPDQWSFGANNGLTIHATFDEFKSEFTTRFLGLLRQPSMEYASAA